uniref:L-aminoadipate-semialdehyde dehydrogenase-phosphopantetheinyl transferase n=1 Tax=Bracon brevicornis TaxID=1563983 RepID=A0A6V7LRL4_9HYME
MFCRHWALKESYVKALSVGITVNLEELDFHTKSNLNQDRVITDTILYKNGAQQNWIFEESLIDCNHCVSVAFEKGQIDSSHENNLFRELKFDELMVNAVPLYPEDENYSRVYFAKAEKP